MTMILIVDDDIVVTSIIETIFSSLGYPTKTVPSIAQAKEYLFQDPNNLPTAAICDLNLHNESGLDFMMYMKLTFPNLPFVLMSAETESQRAKQYPISPDAFLPKPFTVESIEALLSSLGIPRTE